MRRNDKRPRLERDCSQSSWAEIISYLQRHFTTLKCSRTVFHKKQTNKKYSTQTQNTWTWILKEDTIIM